MTLALGTGDPAHAGPFQLYSQPADEEENPNARVCVLRMDELRVRFLPPYHWEVRREGTNQALLFTAPDLSAGIRLDLAVDTNAIPASLDPPSLRAAVVEAFPDARIEREFDCVVGGRKGVAFDLRRTLPHSTQAAFRLAYVPYAGGMAGFELRTTTNHLARARRALGRLMNSFRVESPAQAEPKATASTR